MTTDAPAPVPIDQILAVPANRRGPLADVLALIRDADDIALTTHVNADGDGAGSQAALAAWLLERGKRVAILNPTPFPDRFRFLLPEGVEVIDPGTELDRRASSVPLLLVLDTGEPGRIGRVAKGLRDGAHAVIDHHPMSDRSIPGPGLRDPAACATGELIYDLFTLAAAEAGDERGQGKGQGSAPREWSPSMVQGLYAAIETDTGSFRFSNTTARTHAIAADLLDRGLDPEASYRRLHATVPLERITMIRLALDGLETDPDLPITWITVPRTVTHDMEASADDLDDVAEYARNIEGTEVALLFRQTLDGSTKVSFRSNGDVNVNTIAREFGGGGHVKAAGALISGPLESTRPRVLEATRAAVRQVLDQDGRP